MMKKLLQLVCLVLLLSTSGCTLAIQRASEAEARAHDYAVWILDQRKSDRQEVRDQRKAAVRDMEFGISRLVSKGKLTEALAARDKIIKYIEEHTPSFADAIANVKALFKAVKE